MWWFMWGFFLCGFNGHFCGFNGGLGDDFFVVLMVVFVVV